MKTEYHYVVDKSGHPLFWREAQGKGYWSSGREGEVLAYTNPDLIVILNNLAELSELDPPRNADGQWLQAASVVDWANLVMQELKVRMKFTLSQNSQEKSEGGGWFSTAYAVKYTSNEIHVEAKDVLAGKVLSKLKKGELTRRKPKPEEMIVDID